jgi:serine/threonine protein kinase
LESSEELQCEFNVLSRLASCFGAPTLVSYAPVVFQYTRFSLLVTRPIGTPLSQAEFPRTEKNLWQVAVHVLRALRSIHQAGFVHRDVKPSNLVWCDPPYNGARIVLIDFGVAEQVGSTVGFAGTRLFASVPALQNEPPAPSDDLESLLYTTWKILGGSSPRRK